MIKMNSKNDDYKSKFKLKYKNFLNREENFLYLNNNKFYLNSEFAFYLAGLIEGDGSIIVPSLLNMEKGLLIYPSIKITFAYKDLPLANKLNAIFGYGKIYKEKGNYINLVFYKLEILLLITNLINGKMRTPKVEALNRLIDWFNIKYDLEIVKIGLDFSNIDSNSWLSGFLDCDSNFYSNFNKGKNNYAVNLTCYMRLSQRRILLVLIIYCLIKRMIQSRL
jgi:hypothetical protein